MADRIRKGASSSSRESRSSQRRGWALVVSLAATAALPLPALAGSADATQIVSDRVASQLELRGVEIATDGSVAGSVVNGSGVPIRDVELLVTHTWSWANEHHPGDDSPGRASRVRVAGEISPGRSLTFSYTPDPPLPKRADGAFQTAVAVQSFTEVERP